MASVWFAAADREYAVGVDLEASVCLADLYLNTPRSGKIYAVKRAKKAAHIEKYAPNLQRRNRGETC